jgi:UDP-N-acetyl-D-glucosamine dehydrogenase
VVIVTDHSAFDYAGLLERSRVIVDTRNALKGFSSPKIVRL